MSIHTYELKLFALLEALEIPDPRMAMELSPEKLAAIGRCITWAGKRGAHLMDEQSLEHAVHNK